MPHVEFSFTKLRRYITRIFDLRFAIAFAILVLIMTAIAQNPRPSNEKPPVVEPAKIDDRLLYTFNVDGTIEETGSINDSKSPYWWLDSGGRIFIIDGVGQTIQGELPSSDAWYEEYRDTNPDDTDGGKYPQNLLRLVSRSLWNNVRVEASMQILDDHFSKSPNRNESNGLLIMSRYSDDGRTLYYSGIRVDGTAVIKKKYKGTYYTMAQEKVFSGTYTRDPKARAYRSLLPHDEWIRLRSDTVTDKDGNVTIKLSMQDTKTKEWKPLLMATDKSQYDDSPPIVGGHSVGIRTDFMDVKFDDILMEKI